MSSPGKRKPAANRRRKPIFFDPTLHRRILVVAAASTVALVVLVWGAAFVGSLYRTGLPAIPEATAPFAQQAPSLAEMLPEGAGRRGPPGDLGSAPAPGSGAPAPAPPDADGPAWRAPAGEIHAYLPSWSRAAFRSLRENIAAIDVVLPEWYELDIREGALRGLQASHQPDLRRFIYDNRAGLTLVPVVRAFDPSPAQAADALAVAETRGALVAALALAVTAGGYDGICLQTSGATPEVSAGIIRMMTELKAKLGASGREACLVSTLSDPVWGAAGIGRAADRMILLGFEEPGPASRPAPLAPQRWFEAALPDALANLEPDKVVIGLGASGFDWVSGAAGPRPVNFAEAARLAGLYGGDDRFDTGALNTGFGFTDAEGRRHEIWMLDAVSAHNQMVTLRDTGASGIAVWPLGGEDAALWRLLDKSPSGLPVARLLAEVSIDGYVGYEGAGPLLRVIGTAAPGLRRLRSDPDSGLIVAQSYAPPPRGNTISRRGSAIANEVVLSFDDGPDPAYTSRILDILAEKDVPAAFFVIGSHVLENPEIARRIVAEGHEIGVHTFWHPDISEVSEMRLRFELHATQELIASVTGRYTLYFRAPYGIDEDPQTGAQARLLTHLTDEGYVIVGVEIDSQDWQRPGEERIIETVSRRIARGEGKMILMHDSGGDRRQTLAALPALIDRLRADGYRFVPISRLIEGTAARAAPPPPDAVRTLLNHVSFQALRLVAAAIGAVFVATIVAGILRSVLIISLAMWRRAHAAPPEAQAPPVTVAIPAFCEELEIERAVAAALASDYPDLRVIVVDDGSTDATATVVKRAFGHDPRVRLVRQRNRGKSAALNHAHRLAETPLVVAIDADTILARDAVARLVRHFADPAVGAVAGNVKVGNRRNLITRLQAIEYITAQNLDRRAYEAFNAIMVVPGAIGAWRRSAVAAAGGYSDQTIAEDADMSVSVIRAGYRIAFEAGALAYTEAPETVRQLVRQRLRWNFGMMQVAWKHKRAFREGRGVGFTAIPDLALFGVVFPLFAPIADLVLIGTALRFASRAAAAPAQALTPEAAYVFAAYLAYLLTDLMIAALAFSLEPGEDRRLLPWVLVQRFCYRQIYWFVVLRSVGRALTGRFTGWRKVTRTAAVTLGAPATVPRARHRRVAMERADAAGAEPGPQGPG